MRRRGKKMRVIGLVADICYGVALLGLCLVALNPDIYEGISLLAWFGAPDGSLATIAVVLAFPLLHFGFARLSGAKVLDGPPLILLAVAAASALALGLASYWRCHGTHAPLFSPLTWTLALFAGEYQEPFGGSCEPAPVALDLARLLAIATTLGTALTAALTLLRSERDRLATWRARSLTVIVGLDDDAVSIVRAVARTMSPGEILVVLTADSNTPAARDAHSLGAKIRLVDLSDVETISTLGIWNRLTQLYLLSADPVQNLRYFTAIDAQVGGQRFERVRLPVILRVDNPWQAEVLRRRLLARADRRWVADAVGRYEATAARLVRHMTYLPGDYSTPPTVLLCGLSPLTYAVASALAQSQRERGLVLDERATLPTSVIVFARGAQSFVDDHRMRQSTVAAAATLPVSPYDAEPTVDVVTEYIGAEPSRYWVVFGDPSSEADGIRLAARFPELRMYVASAMSTSFGDFSLTGNLFSFPISMELDADAPHDSWERAAELIHEHYSRGGNRSRRASKPWKELDSFFKGSNRRQVLNALWIVEAHGNHTWNSFESGPAAPLPTGFDSMTPLRQLQILGFDEETVGRMIKAEHEDWYRFYQAGGWEYSVVRDDALNRHDKLLPWDEFAKHPDFVGDAQRSLVGTLINLRNLGYRSVPKATQQQAPAAGRCHGVD